MISYDDALQRVLDTVQPVHPVEVPLDKAAGLTLAASAAARWDMPRFDNSSMDGFAVKGVPQPVDAPLSVIGASYAGHHFPGEVKPGQAVRITTGAILPQGADTVVPLEETTEKSGSVSLHHAPGVGQYVRRQGTEYHQGDVLVEAGTSLQAGEIALLASAGVEHVSVYPRLRVALISTGDELVELGQPPGPGQIINSNLHFLRTRLHECGYTPVCLGIGTDDQDTIDQLISQALDADLIITTGGVSVGAKDHVQATIEQRRFEKVFWKVAIKPGKPVLFGKVDDKPFFGLPGNPAATASTFELFVKPALYSLSGRQARRPSKRSGTLATAVKGGETRQSFLWCRLEWVNGGYQVTVTQPQDSGQNRSLAGANALLPVPVGTEALHCGDTVDVLLLGH